ncbi:MAG: DUF4252 domain-containing protein [Draconibacterium sp.]
MKRLILIAFVLLLSAGVQAQDTQRFFETLTGKYADNDGFSASMLTSDMFDLYLKRKKLDETSEVAAALKKLDRIMVVSQSKVGLGMEALSTGVNKSEKPKNESLEVLHGELLNHYKGGGFTLLKTEKRMGEDVKVYLKKENDKISSLALITNSSAVTSLVELDGDIDLANVASLSSALNVRGLENLNKIDNRSSYYLYGTGASEYFDQGRMEVIEERAREMAERQVELSEEQVRRIQERTEKQAQREMEVAERYREMAERYQREPIFLNYPGDSTVYYLNGKKVEADKIKDLKKLDIKTIDVKRDDKNNGITIVKITTK